MADRAACDLAPAVRPLPLALRRALAILLLLPALSLPLAAQSPQEVQKAAEQAIRRLNLQTELPRGPEPRGYRFELSREMLWLLIALAVGVLLYLARDLIPMLRARQGGAWSGDEVMPGAVEAGAPAMALGAADELAAAGRFVEAMHVLLLQSLAEIRARLDQRFADSLTSREILRHAKLSETGRSSLRDIVNRVEWTYFGEHPAALADYAACRVSFNALAQALHDGAPA
jgi:hypothetical protein